MSLRSTPQRYGRVPVSIHWLSALAVVIMLATGLTMDSLGDAPPGVILPVHVTVGAALARLTLLRIVWWFAIDRQPAPPEGLGVVQVWSARVVHLGLYLTLVVTLASGIATVALTGAAPAIFAGGALPDFAAVPPFVAHATVSRVLLVLAVAHVAAALWHQFIRRDRLLARMS